MVDINDQTSRLLPIDFPLDLLREGFFYDANAYPGLCVNGDLLVYNFPPSPNIYTYQPATGQKNAIEMDAYQWPVQPPTPNEHFHDLDRRFEIFDTTPVIYHSLLFDMDRSLYYRVHQERDESSQYGCESRFRCSMPN